MSWFNDHNKKKFPSHKKIMIETDSWKNFALAMRGYYVGLVARNNHYSPCMSTPDVMNILEAVENQTTYTTI